MNDDDLRTSLRTLHRAIVRGAPPVDVSAVENAAMTRRRRTRALTATGAIAIVSAVVVPSMLLDRGPGNGPGDHSLTVGASTPSARATTAVVTTASGTATSPSDTPACTASALSVDVTWEVDAIGRKGLRGIVYDIHLRNTAGSTCLLSAPPTVALDGVGTGIDSRGLQGHTGSRERQLLAPHDFAEVLVVWLPSYCGPVTQRPPALSLVIGDAKLGWVEPNSLAPPNSPPVPSCDASQPPSRIEVGLYQASAP